MCFDAQTGVFPPEADWYLRESLSWNLHPFDESLIWPGADARQLVNLGVLLYFATTMFAHLYILGFRPEDSQPGNNQCLHPACLTLTPEIIWSFKVFVHSLKISFDTPRHLETSQVLILDGHFRWGCQMFYNFEFSKNSPSENAWCP